MIRRRSPAIYNREKTFRSSKLGLSRWEDAIRRSRIASNRGRMPVVRWFRWSNGGRRPFRRRNTSPGGLGAGVDRLERSCPAGRTRVGAREWLATDAFGAVDADDRSSADGGFHSKAQADRALGAFLDEGGSFAPCRGRSITAASDAGGRVCQSGALTSTASCTTSTRRRIVAHG